MSASKRRLPIVGRPGERTIAEAAERAASALLAARRSPPDIGEHALGWFETTLDAVLPALPPERALACATGCAHCCYLKVTVTPVEALRVAAHLRATCGGATLSKIKRRVAETDAKTRGKSAAERLALRLPCPLLDEERRCLAYEARPLSCAGTNSYDADGCSRAVETGDDAAVASYVPQLRTANAIAAGITQALFAHGRDGRILELVAALRVLLDDPDAKTKWSEGRPVLASAVDAEFAAAVLGG